MFRVRDATDYLAILLAAVALQLAVTLAAVASGGSCALIRIAHAGTGAALDAGGQDMPLPFDLLSGLILVVATAVGLVMVLYSISYLSALNREHPLADRRRIYLGWLLAAIGATMGVALAQNLLQLVLFVELLTLCAWGLISFYHDDRSRRAGFKALLIIGTGTVCFFAALVVLYASLGSGPFDFDAMVRLPAAAQTTVCVLLLVGVATKAGLFPFFTWVLDATEGPITSIGYLFAGGLAVAIVYMVARLLLANEDVADHPAAVLGLVARVTVIVGIVLLFFQQDLKRIVALFALVNLGHMIVALTAGAQGSEEMFSAGLLHLIPYALGTAIMFLSVGMITWATGVSKVEQLGGAIQPPLRMAALGFFVGVFTLAGMPPFAGFWTKLHIISGAALLGAEGTEKIVSLLAESTVALAFFIWLGHRVFFGSASAAVLEAEKTPRMMRALIIVLAVLCVAVPFLLFDLFSLVISGM
jgi:NADH:ubiquinone oxidoreductase subunit 5 (subunit L)/multisubunit Na+/H+ antiporter MnhA subunit